MENVCNKIVEADHFFPIVKDMLARGQKVIFTVSGNSMQPWIADNRDQVLLASIKDRHLSPGDIILFRNPEGRYLLHRIYKKDSSGYHTIGDACLWEDGIVKPNEIIGVVEEIYRKGRKIDCNSMLWKSIFTVWRKLLPIRKYLLVMCHYLLRIIGWVKKRLH